MLINYRGKIMEWQPIETAPRDMSDVLLCSDHEDGEYPISIGFFCEAGVWIDSTSGDEVFNITHWMPLPAPPTGAIIEKTQQ